MRISDTERQPSDVDVTIETRDVAAVFQCPYCGFKHRIDIDLFDIADLWCRQERYECDGCGKEFDLNGYIERDV